MPPAPASTETDAVPERATLGGDTQSRLEQVVLGILIVVPFLAVAAAVPVAWGGWLGWSDAVIFLVAYAITGHGITVGFHRLFTHKSFKPNRAVKVALAVAGSMAIQGPVVRWVADHRKHHKFSDRDGDPHSPWRYGTTVRALTKGFLYAHLMWLFNPEQTPQRKYAPDLMKDRDIVRISRQFPLWVVVSLTAPAVAGGLVTWSWQGAVTAFFWASLVRVCTTSPGRSTRSATPSATGRSFPATNRPTSGGWRSPRWASPGTTCTTPTRPAPGTASGAVRSTCRPASSGRLRSSAGRTRSAGPPPPAEPGSSPAPDRAPGRVADLVVREALRRS